MKLIIDVTQQDISEGCRVDTTGKLGGCMIWKAFNRCTEGSFPYFRVNYRDILIYKSHEHMLDDVLYQTPVQRILLPKFVEPKIEAFDLGHKVYPFSFEIDIPLEESNYA